MNNCIDWQDKPNIKPTRRFSLRVDQAKPNIPSNETSPCSSPLLIPPLNILSSPVSSSHLMCLSPLPDVRRNSEFENFWNSLSLPAPKEFADPNSRKNSIQQEMTEKGSEVRETSTNITQHLEKIEETKKHSKANTYLSPENIIEHMGFGYKPPDLKTTGMQSSSASNDINLLQPVEVYERNLLRTLQEKQLNDKLEDALALKSNNNTLQVPNINILDNRPIQINENVIVSENLCIVEIDHLEKSSSDEMPGEASDLLSTISNEECSVKSEILDRRFSDTSQLNVYDLIQDINSEDISHIDSLENSETTDVLHGESLIDDISSVLAHDIFSALQDNTMTSDDTTLCTIEAQKKRKSSFKPNNLNRDVQQCGFENRVFDLDNR